jgi:hypothetical protein
MRRALVLVAAVAAAAFVAGCGGGDSESDTAPVAVGTVQTGTAETGSLPEWVEGRLAAAGPDVALVFSTSDYEQGENRISFLLVRDDGSLVTAPSAEVWVGQEGGEPTKVTATLESVSGEAQTASLEAHEEDEEVIDIYVARVPTPAVGLWWVVAEPSGGELQAVGTMDVLEDRAAPSVGEQAIASDNPTVADAPAEEITTADPPDTELLQISVADALAAGEPFVVVFATPQYCTSRACGPTVQVVQRVAADFGDSGIRFIHIEIYEDNDPQLGPNEWVQEWGLPTEPWTFVVDAGGTIRTSFEGAYSADELTDAVESELGRAALPDDEELG